MNQDMLIEKCFSGPKNILGTLGSEVLRATEMMRKHQEKDSYCWRK